MGEDFDVKVVFWAKAHETRPRSVVAQLEPMAELIPYFSSMFGKMDEYCRDTCAQLRYDCNYSFRTDMIDAVYEENQAGQRARMGGHLRRENLEAEYEQLLAKRAEHDDIPKPRASGRGGRRAWLDACGHKPPVDGAALQPGHGLRQSRHLATAFRRAQRQSGLRRRGGHCATVGNRSDDIALAVEQQMENQATQRATDRREHDQVRHSR